MVFISNHIIPSKHHVLRTMVVVVELNIETSQESDIETDIEFAGALPFQVFITKLVVTRTWYASVIVAKPEKIL